MIKYVFLMRVPPQSFPYHEWFPELMPESALIVHSGRFGIWGVDEACQQTLRAAYASTFFVQDYDTGGEVERLVIELGRAAPLQAIITQSEFDVLRAARLREYLGVPGLRPAAAALFRDKYAMKEAARASGLPVPRCSPVDCYTDVHAFASTHGFPVVVKPRLGAGSMGVHVLRDEAQLAAFAGHRLWQSLDDVAFMMVEEFVAGGMLHVDGMVSDGRTVVAVPSRYINGCLAFQHGDFLGSVALDRDDPACARALDFVDALVAVFPFPSAASFHVELFERPDGSLCLCEVAIRTGGAKVRQTVQLMTDVDLDRHVSALQCGRSVPVPAVSNGGLAGWGLIPPRAGRLLDAPRQIDEEGVVDYQLAPPSLPHDFQSARTSIDMVSSFIVRGASSAEVQERVLRTAAQLAAGLRWEAPATGGSA